MDHAHHQRSISITALIDTPCPHSSEYAFGYSDLPQLDAIGRTANAGERDRETVENGIVRNLAPSQLSGGVHALQAQGADDVADEAALRGSLLRKVSPHPLVGSGWPGIRS